MTCEPDDAGTMCLSDSGRHGDRLTDALAEIKARHVPLVNIMHTDVKHVDACLDVLNQHWSGLVGVYAHSSDFVDGKWIFESTISPADYAAASRRWLKRNISVIGGCCGIRPDHIAEVRKTAFPVKAHPPS